MTCVTYNGQMKKRRIKGSLDLHRIPHYGSSIWEIINTVATCTVDPLECSNPMHGMPYFRWWILVLLTKWSCSITTVIIIDVNDVIIHLCRCLGGQGGVILPIQLAEGGKPLPLTHRHNKAPPIWSRWRQEGRRFRDLLEAWTEGAAPGAGVDGVDSGSRLSLLGR